MKELTGRQLHHAHFGGRRCCGRLLSEKCSPEEEATKTDKVTGEKSCCKGHGHEDALSSNGGGGTEKI